MRIDVPEMYVSLSMNKLMIEKIRRHKSSTAANIEPKTYIDIYIRATY
jgi:hypothetical protein